MSNNFCPEFILFKEPQIWYIHYCMIVFQSSFFLIHYYINYKKHDQDENRGLKSVANCARCPTKKQSAQFATGVPPWDMKRKLRLVSHEKPCGAKCDSCPTLGQSAQNAKPFRKFAKSNFGLEIGLFKKKVCGAICDQTFQK